MQSNSCALCQLARVEGVRECIFCQHTSRADRLGLATDAVERRLFSRDPFSSRANGLADPGLPPQSQTQHRLWMLRLSSRHGSARDFIAALNRMPDEVRRLGDSAPFNPDAPRDMILVRTSKYGMLMLARYQSASAPSLAATKAAVSRMSSFFATAPTLLGTGVSCWAMGRDPASRAGNYVGVGTVALGELDEAARDQCVAVLCARAEKHRSRLRALEGICGMRLVRDGDVLLLILAADRPGQGLMAQVQALLHAEAAAPAAAGEAGQCCTRDGCSPRILLLTHGAVVWHRHVDSSSPRFEVAGDASSQPVSFRLSLSAAESSEDDANRRSRLSLASQPSSRRESRRWSTDWLPRSGQSARRKVPPPARRSKSVDCPAPTRARGSGGCSMSSPLGRRSTPGLDRREGEREGGRDALPAVLQRAASVPRLSRRWSSVLGWRGFRSGQRRRRSSERAGRRSASSVATDSEGEGGAPPQSARGDEGEGSNSPSNSPPGGETESEQRRSRFGALGGLAVASAALLGVAALKGAPRR